MTPFSHIKDSELFNRVYNKSKSYHSDTVIVMHMPSQERMVGYTVSKKVAKAVMRNKIKRRLRAIFKAEQSSLKEGFYLLVAKQSSSGADFKKLYEDTKRLLSLFRSY